MKKTILLSFFLLFTLSLFSQEQKDQYIYCELLGRGNLTGTKVRVEIDFGQKTKWGEDKRIRDENGDVIVFNSMVDAMNWLGQKGWEFCQAYVVSTSATTHVYHWLLKLNISSLSPEELEQIKGIFKTKEDFKNLEKKEIANIY